MPTTRRHRDRYHTAIATAPRPRASRLPTLSGRLNATASLARRANHEGSPARAGWNDPPSDDRTTNLRCRKSESPDASI